MVRDFGRGKPVNGSYEVGAQLGERRDVLGPKVVALAHKNSDVLGTGEGGCQGLGLGWVRLIKVLI